MIVVPVPQFFNHEKSDLTSQITHSDKKNQSFLKTDLYIVFEERRDQTPSPDSKGGVQVQENYNFEWTVGILSHLLNTCGLEKEAVRGSLIADEEGSL